MFDVPSVIFASRLALRGIKGAPRTFDTSGKEHSGSLPRGAARRLCYRLHEIVRPGTRPRSDPHSFLCSPMSDGQANIGMKALRTNSLTGLLKGMLGFPRSFKLSSSIYGISGDVPTVIVVPAAPVPARVTFHVLVACPRTWPSAPSRHGSIRSSVRDSQLL